MGEGENTDKEQRAERLRKARVEAGFESASAASRAMDVEVPTYTHHENGTRGYVEHADRYAQFFRVRIEWLLTGRGPMSEEQIDSRPIGSAIQTPATARPNAPTVDPLIQPLLARLPKSGVVWPEDERKLWLQSLEANFRLAYKDA